VYVRKASVSQGANMVKPASDEEGAEKGNPGTDTEGNDDLSGISEETWNEIFVRAAQLKEQEAAPQRKARGGCFCCGSKDHQVKDCPRIAEAQKNAKSQGVKSTLPAKQIVQKPKTSQASVSKAFKLAAKVLAIQNDQSQSEAEEEGDQKDLQKE